MFNRVQRRYRITRISKNGFVLENLLIVMILTVFLIPIMTFALAVAGSTLKFDETIQDETALFQMRKIMMIGDGYECVAGMIHFVYQGESNEFAFMNRHLILKPGTQIFISDIDAADFSIDHGIIYLQYRRGEQSRQIALIST
ncbi:MAG: hypothetical protein EOM64_08705 [Erysipelotrichia bacterium]|nr:hypothetical protein [Erysipelotrichia bacterium]